jgi:hypothetical protein
VAVGSESGLPGDFRSIAIGEEDDLGTEIDIIYTYQVTEYFGFEAGVALFQPGDAIKEYSSFVDGRFNFVGVDPISGEDIFQFRLGDENDDDISRIWGQARLRW